MSHFDVAVLGLGGMGSAALATLARRGCRVVGIEQFPLVHDRGSSHGHSRIIRTAYYEHPSYVPLVKRAFALWRELEAETGVSLLTPSPCLSIGPRDGELIQGVIQSARDHSLAIEPLTAHEIQNRYPAFQLSPDLTGVIEQDAGILRVEACVQAQLAMARKYGATIHAETPARSWTATDSHITIVTDRETMTADRLIISAGAWATQLLHDIGVPLTVMRQTMHWFDSSIDLPIFLVDSPDGPFYGLPSLDGHGVKIARHYGAPELRSPMEIDWSSSDADVAPVRTFLDRYIPTVGRVTHSQVCMYTLSPDRHFVIDRHPRYANVIVAAGFSGHGFKFAPTIGEIVADLAVNGQTQHDIELFRCNRYDLTTRTS